MTRPMAGVAGKSTGKSRADTSGSPLLALRDEVSPVGGPTGGLALTSPWAILTLQDLTRGLTAFRQLIAGPTTESALADLALDIDGPSALPSLYYHLETCRRLRLLCYPVMARDERLFTIVPLTSGFEPARYPVEASARFQLSRFAFLRREAEVLILESPLSASRTILGLAGGAALIAALARPITAADLCEHVEGLSSDQAGTVLSLLAGAGVVAAVRGGTTEEDADPALRQWEVHDLFFHSRSRVGRSGAAFGATFRFLDQLAPLPALKARTAGETIRLDRPDLARLAQSDRPFTAVLEARTSKREYGTEPITVEQLGQFLFRVARVRHTIAPDPAAGLRYEASSRPYPSAGGVYDLELYVTVSACDGLAAGIYHFEPLEHELCKVGEPSERTLALLRDAQQAAGLPVPPQVLITLASRFQRLSWKYSSLAYAAALKNVGALYQTMYLVATAMDLASCALGGGDSDVFAAAAGSDYYREPAVGEFLLGSARTGGG
ncbi:MAG: SagB family peptide dehydrogenase [Candidatus Dormibacteraeota bacterium]|nr:SagB family peptide dehydrogenase [Candidatus Dormibacteraeota bacterium]